MKPKIGLALGGGGARGWCHVGALRALEEAGIVPDVISGTSMGALVGGAVVSGKLDQLEEFAGSITRVSRTLLFDINPGSGGLIEGLLVSEKLKELGYAKSFADTDRPFLAVASDLFNATEVWLRSGDLVEALRASTAIPGVVSPVFLEGRWLLDGGMTNPVPVSACRALGADIVIAVDPNSKLHSYRDRLQNSHSNSAEGQKEGIIEAAPTMVQPYLKSLLGRDPDKPQSPGYFTVLAASIDVMTDQIQRSRLAGDPPHLLVSPNLRHLSLLEFHHASEAIAEGYRAMKMQLGTLSEML